MDENIDIDNLITEIQSRPALWDMRTEEYGDRVKRKECWDEVTNALLRNQNMTIEEKRKVGELLHKKWKNIRDRFARELQERKRKSREGVRKKAPYIYSKQLQFLKDIITPKKTTNYLEPTDSDTEASTYDSDVKKPRLSTTNPSKTKHRKIGKKRRQPYKEELIQTVEKRIEKKVNTESSYDNDDNRHFLLSLLPNLSSLPKMLNTNCRIELLQVISKYETYASHQQPIQQSTIPCTSVSNIFGDNQPQATEEIKHTFSRNNQYQQTQISSLPQKCRKIEESENQSATMARTATT